MGDFTIVLKVALRFFEPKPNLPIYLYIGHQSDELVVSLLYICRQHSYWFAEMMTNIWKDANQLKSTYTTLMTNQSEASVWIGRVLDSVMGLVMKVC